MKTVLFALVIFAIAVTVCSTKRKRKHFCKLPPVPGNATVRYRRFHYKKFTKIGSKIVYSCIKGYFRHGPRKIKCQKNGKWSNIPPVCKVGRCNKPYRLKFLRNGNYITDNENFEYMTTITIVCNQSYSVSTNSPDAMTCTQDKYGQMVWQPPYVPRCYPLRCRDPGTPDDGAMGGSNFRIGSQVQFFCHTGYKLIGDAIRTCLPSGLWSGNQPVCDKGDTDCINPGHPTNGRRFGNRFNVGNKVRFECSSGFTLYGSPERTCKNDGNWTGIPASCEDDNKIIIPPLNETVNLISSNFIEALATETCSVDENGKCLRAVIRGRSINLDQTNGLDIIFMIDSSSSIGKDKFPLALKFTEFLIEKFGVDYGPGGTRIAAITYNTRADLVYNLGDPRVDTVANAKAVTSSITYLGGGTATRSALVLIKNVVPIDKRRTTALIIITDGKHNVEGDPIDIASELRLNYGIKIYAVGIGTSINKRELRLLVGQENKQHVFQLEKFDDFQDIIEKLTHKDYSPCGEGHIKTRGRILGGTEVKESSWPWMVAIYRLEGEIYKSMCGGSFIREDMILTAAHCLEEISDEKRKSRLHENQYRIISGVTKIKRTLAEPHKFDWVERLGLQLKAIHVHPNFTFGEYNQQDYDNDVALLQLQEPVMWTPRVRPICLPGPENFLTDYKAKFERAYGYVSGWGYTSEGNLTLPEKLRIVTLGVNNNETCINDEFKKQLMFCAGDGLGQKDACVGDSGGPFAIPLPTDEDKIQSRYYIMGIVSWAVGRCGDPGVYGYYTRVTNYLNWIEKVMGQFAT